MPTETENLLGLAEEGDRSAIGRLLAKHRRQLRRMVANRMDFRLATRGDASDIVQEALAEASARLPRYARERPMGYYVWLRRLTLDRLHLWRRFHLGSRKRDVRREESPAARRTDREFTPLPERLPDRGTSPSGLAIREEERDQLRVALDRLSEPDRRLLELRYFAGHSFTEIATALGIKEGAAKMRHLRALERFNEQMTKVVEEPVP